MTRPRPQSGDRALLPTDSLSPQSVLHEALQPGRSDGLRPVEERGPGRAVPGNPRAAREDGRSARVHQHQVHSQHVRSTPARAPHVGLANPTSRSAVLLLRTDESCCTEVPQALLSRGSREVKAPPACLFTHREVGPGCAAVQRGHRPATSPNRPTGRLLGLNGRQPTRASPGRWR